MLGLIDLQTYWFDKETLSYGTAMKVMPEILGKISGKMFHQGYQREVDYVEELVVRAYPTNSHSPFKYFTVEVSLRGRWGFNVKGEFAHAINLLETVDDLMKTAHPNMIPEYRSTGVRYSSRTIEPSVKIYPDKTAYDFFSNYTSEQSIRDASYAFERYRFGLCGWNKALIQVLSFLMARDGVKAYYNFPDRRESRLLETHLKRQIRIPLNNEGRTYGKILIVSQTSDWIREQQFKLTPGFQYIINSGGQELTIDDFIVPENVKVKPWSCESINNKTTVRDWFGFQCTAV